MKRVIFEPTSQTIGKNKQLALPGFSIVIPSFMRVDLLRQSLDAIARSNGLNKKFKASVYIVDATPEGPRKKAIIRHVKEFSKKAPFPVHLLQELKGPSITNAKIEGAAFCRNDGNGILLFIDTDIIAMKDTLLNSLNKFKVNRYAAWIGRRSIWKGKGPKNNTLWKPERLLETRTKEGLTVQRDKRGRIIKNKRGLRTKEKRSIFISAIHGDYVCMYKEVYFRIGGYDVLFGNHGENVDLSIKCWRHGYPLVYEDDIVVYHILNAAYSIMRKAKTSKKRRAMAIFSTPLKICYIYGTLHRPSEMEKFNLVVYEKWVKNIFKYSSEEDIPPQMIYYIAEYIDSLINRAHLLERSRKKASNTPYREFMPYDIFKNLALFKECIKEAPGKLQCIRRKALLLGKK
jgi:GT2 family glycosyltransferase